MSAIVKRFYNARLLRGNYLEGGEIWVSSGKIVEKSKIPAEEVDVRGLILAPGYIDMQINGGFGVDLSSEAEKVEEVAQQLPHYGVTSFLPTVITSSQQHYHATIAHLQAKMEVPLKGAQIVGIHLEGPYLNPRQCGAHNPAFLKSCEFKPDTVYGSLKFVKMVTLAPELEGAYSLILQLKQQGVIISAGHTCATSHQMEAAIAAGVGCVTHLFNAMSAFHHREPGVVGTVLTHPTLSFSVIGDPCHIHPKALKLAWCARPSGLILISDAMAGLGRPAGNMRLSSMNVEVKEGKAYLKGTERLAGSIIGLDSAVRYLYAVTGCSQAEALQAATGKPATLLGLLPKKGTLDIGADADFNLLDDNLFVKTTYIRGKKIN
jgi:N-acetylglucosamine-6-phosphate deacetylase